MGALARPYDLVTAPWPENPHADVDLEASIESDPHLEDLQIEKKQTRRAEIIVCIDTSLSMTGKKLALTAVSLAVLALQLDPEDLAVICFESQGDTIKPLMKKMDVFTLLEKFMEVPARGLTNIEAGLRRALVEAENGKQGRQAVILMTDGRHTSGADPSAIAPLLPKLYVVQTGNPWSSPRFCRNLAQLGRGKHLRISKIEHLPKALYSLVHEIIR